MYIVNFIQLLKCYLMRTILFDDRFCKKDFVDIVHQVGRPSDGEEISNPSRFVMRPKVWRSFRSSLKHKNTFIIMSVIIFKCVVQICTTHYIKWSLTTRKSASVILFTWSVNSWSSLEVTLGGFCITVGLN